MVFIRIDDRFIHGQVTVSWVRYLKVDEIWVVSDEIANNDLLKAIQKSSAPPGIKVRIYSIEEAINEIVNKNLHDKTLILVENPRVALQLIESGLNINSVNLGQMGHKEGSTRIEKTVSVTEQDIEALRELINKGIRIIYQQLPTHKPKEIDKL